MSIFTGAGVALITPMNADGSVNYEKMREIIEFQIKNQTDAIIICGTTGEASTLSHEEHIECIRFCCEVADKRIPVVAGTGSNCTATAVYLSQEAEKAGADGLLLVTPYYNKCTQNGLKAHFTQVAESVNIPILLYNIPGRTGVEVDLYSGNDDQIVPVVSLGGKGVISVLSNILPRQTHEMVADFLAGDAKKSMEMQLSYFDLIGALFCEVNPIPVKKAMNLMGMEVGSLRAPLTEMEEKNAARLADEMKKAGIL